MKTCIIKLERRSPAGCPQVGRISLAAPEPQHPHRTVVLRHEVVIKGGDDVNRDQRNHRVGGELVEGTNGLEQVVG